MLEPWFDVRAIELQWKMMTGIFLSPEEGTTNDHNHNCLYA